MRDSATHDARRPETTPSETTVPVVEVRDVTVRYGDLIAVDRVSLSVSRGGLTALVGPSGCGKTSLLRAVAGFEEPAGGTILVDGKTVAGPGLWVPPERRRIGMVFQQGALFPHLTVEGNVLYGLRRRPDARRRAYQVLELVGIAELAGRYPDELSGGQQQRVALARALAPEPPVVLLDEPFASLDAELRVRLREEVRRILVAAGATGILVTHDQEEALSVADRVAVMRRGRVLQVGPPEEIYHRPATVGVARFVGDGQLVDCRVEGDQLHCCFGSAPTDAPEGEALLLVRPEDLEAREVTGPVGSREVRGEIVGRRFFGHDVLDQVRLRDGQTLEVRHLSSVLFPVGTRVRLSLRPRRMPIFSTDEAAPALGTTLPKTADEAEGRAGLGGDGA